MEIDVICNNMISEELEEYACDALEDLEELLVELKPPITVEMSMESKEGAGKGTHSFTLHVKDAESDKRVKKSGADAEEVIDEAIDEMAEYLESHLEGIVGKDLNSDDEDEDDFDCDCDEDEEEDEDLDFDDEVEEGSCDCKGDCSCS